MVVQARFETDTLSGDSPRTIPMSTSARIGRFLSVSLVAISLVVGNAACHPTYRTHGTTGVVGRYAGIDLTADLPGTVSVAAAHAAAEEQFRDQGYSIMSSEGTESEATVVALAPRHTDYPRVHVKVTAGDGVTKVAIWRSPINEEALCRGILSRMCKKLGL